MRSINRRIKKLEIAWIPAESPESIRLQARIEAARRRIGEGQQAGRIPPQLPYLVENTAEISSHSARLNLARARLTRQGLFEQCRSVAAEPDHSATDQEREHAG